MLVMVMLVMLAGDANYAGDAGNAGDAGAHGRCSDAMVSTEVKCSPCLARGGV